MRSSNAFLLASVLAGFMPGGQDPAKAPPPVQGPATTAPARAKKQARPADAAALFKLLTTMTGLEARFEEEKHLALLVLPLQSKGRLYFMRPGYLSRIVEQPEPATLTISPSELRMASKTGVEIVDLRRSDKVRLFITSLVLVFAGDEEALARSYTIVFSPDPDSDSAWKLSLTPREPPLTQMIKQLCLRGEGEAVVEIEVQEPNGDRTITRIVAADPERRFTAAEQKQLFGIQPQ